MGDLTKSLTVPHGLQPAHNPSREQVHMQLQGKRILLVEDNQGNAAIMQMLLEQEGGKVFRARWTGTEALETVRRCLPIDALLLDLMLPNNVTGFDVLASIRGEPDLQHIPAIAVSASDPSISIPKARESGFNGYIPKPVDFFKFAAQIASVIGGEPVWSTGRDL